jgi:hypothetical protein
MILAFGSLGVGFFVSLSGFVLGSRMGASPLVG